MTSAVTIARLSLLLYLLMDVTALVSSPDPFQAFQYYMLKSAAWNIENLGMDPSGDKTTRPHDLPPKCC